MIMAEPTLEALHKRHRPCEITYRTHRHVYDLMLHHPLISKIICTRTGCWTLTPGGYDVHVNLHGTIENAPHGKHGIDVFAEAAGVTLERRTPKLWLVGPTCPVVTEDDRYPVISHPPVAPRDPVDIALHLPHSPRNDLWKQHDIVSEVSSFFSQHGESLTLLIVGQDPIEPGKSHILKMAHEIESAKMFIGPDSGGYHMAVALGKPTVVSLTDQFPASMRGYPKAVCVGDHDLSELLSVSLAMYRKIKCAPRS